MIVKIFGDSNKVFEYSSSELNVCHYSVVPGNGLMIQLAKIVEQGDYNSLEFVAKEYVGQKVTFEIYKNNGEMVKQVELMMKRYVLDEQDSTEGIIERLFASEQ